jgi:peptide methionine sulfoxide reductase msrA/msrB
MDNKIAAKKSAKLERAIFASGCFWGTQHYFDQIDGVLKTTVGFCGGEVRNPSYEQVSTGKTGHAESIEVIFDQKKVSYEQLAKVFFETHDPTQIGGQGPDIGPQYRSEIFYLNQEQKLVAQKLIKILEEKGMKIATQVTKATKFWPAEEYHQKYYEKIAGTPYCHIYRKLF